MQIGQIIQVIFFFKCATKNPGEIFQDLFGLILHLGCRTKFVVQCILFMNTNVGKTFFTEFEQFAASIILTPNHQQKTVFLRYSIPTERVFAIFSTCPSVVIIRVCGINLKANNFH